MTVNNLQIAVLCFALLLALYGSFINYVKPVDDKFYGWTKGLRRVATTFTLTMGVLHVFKLLKEALAQ
jgi:hypothetical protein